MQAQRPPEMPKLYSQAHKPPSGKGAEPPGSGGNSGGEKKSFTTNTLPGLVMIAALTGLGILGWYAYEETMSPRDVSDIPVIKAETMPFKIKPVDPGGAQIKNLDKTVYNTIANEENAVKQRDQINTVESIEEPMDRETIMKMADSSPASNPSEPKAEPTIKIEEPEAQVMVEKKTEQEVAENSQKVPYPVPDYYFQDGKEKEGENFEKAPIPVKRPPEEVAQAVTEQVVPPPASMPYAKPKKIVSETREKQLREFKNSIRVQLGAFRSTDEVRKTWSKLRSKYPNILGSLSYGIQQADLGSKGIFYRLHAGPLKNKDAASILCKKLIAKGQGCFVAK